MMELLIARTALDNTYTGKIDVNFAQEAGKTPARFTLKVYLSESGNKLASVWL